jgi:hypothetical protein
MAVLLNSRNLARSPFCYKSFSSLLSISSSHPHITSLHHHHNHNQLKLLPSPHHTIFYSHHRNLHTPPNPLATMNPRAYPQFLQATAPVEQHSAEEPFAFPTYALPSIQQMVQSSAPVPDWGSHYQGEQYALPQATPPAAWSTQQAVETSAPVPGWGANYQGEHYALPQAAPAVWSTEQVVQPTASVPYGNYGYQMGQYGPLPITPCAGRRTIRRSSTITPGMIRRTPGAISPASIPFAAVPWHGTAPLMPAPRVHRPVAHQPQQRRAHGPAPTGLPNGHRHDHPELTDREDQKALHKLCEYSNGRGRHGESCANVGAPATAKFIREYHNGNTKGAKESFHRLASKNLNQKVNRERARRDLAAEVAARRT